MRKRLDRRQVDMFPSGEDLPLFSGTPVPAPPGAFYRPRPEIGRQVSWAACPICYDTGQIASHRCPCNARKDSAT